MNLSVRGYFLLSSAWPKHDRASKRISSQYRRPGRQSRRCRPYLQHQQGACQFAAACEWGRYSIVNAICPGFFPSKMTRGTLEKLGEDKLAEHAPLRRLGDDEDLKGITLLYASDAGKHITGQWLAVDGGVSVVTGG